MRRRMGYVLIGAGMLTLAGTLAFAVTLLPAYKKMQDTGDGTAFGLGTMILFFWLLPIAAALLLSGLMLYPRGYWPGLRWLPRRAVAVCAWIGAILLSVRLFWFLGDTLARSQQIYGYQSNELMRLFLQDLALSLPLLALAAVLAWAGVWLWKARPEP